MATSAFTAYVEATVDTDPGSSSWAGYQTVTVDEQANTEWWVAATSEWQPANLVSLS